MKITICKQNKNANQIFIWYTCVPICKKDKKEKLCGQSTHVDFKNRQLFIWGVNSQNWERFWQKKEKLKKKQRPWERRRRQRRNGKSVSGNGFILYMYATYILQGT